MCARPSLVRRSTGPPQQTHGSLRLEWITGSPGRRATPWLLSPCWQSKPSAVTQRGGGAYLSRCAMKRFKRRKVRPIR